MTKRKNYKRREEYRATHKKKHISFLEFNDDSARNMKILENAKGQLKINVKVKT